MAAMEANAADVRARRRFTSVVYGSRGNGDQRGCEQQGNVVRIARFDAGVHLGDLPAFTGAAHDGRVREACDGQVDETCPRVKLPHRLTDREVADIAGSLRKLARASSLRVLTLDAGEMTDLSARGLGLLVALTRLAAGQGARVVVVDVAGPLHALMSAAHVDYRPRAEGLGEPGRTDVVNRCAIDS